MKLTPLRSLGLALNLACALSAPPSSRRRALKAKSVGANMVKGAETKVVFYLPETFTAVHA